MPSTAPASQCTGLSEPHCAGHLLPWEAQTLLTCTPVALKGTRRGLGLYPLAGTSLRSPEKVTRCLSIQYPISQPDRPCFGHRLWSREPVWGGMP